MNSGELKRWLEKQGAVFTPAKGSHVIVRLGDRRSVIPMHGKKELGTSLVEKIKKQLGLK
jgi:mRNA interferase HicA